VGQLSPLHPDVCRCRARLDHDSFEEALEIAKEDKGIWLDTEMEAEDWRALVGEYKKLVEKQWGQPFPQDVNAQLWGAVGAVFGSWESERAKVYRRLNTSRQTGARR
jgi:pyruvate,orthophosphate dikinase